MSPILNPGGSLPGAAVWRGPFTVTHATPGIATGKTIFVPTIGDLLLDVVALVPELWDGTTPQLDYGQFGDYGAGAQFGIWNSVYGAALLLGSQDAPPETVLPSLNAGMQVIGVVSPVNFTVAGANVNRTFAGVAGYAATGLPFLTATPFELAVSQDGTTTGGATGATTGSVTIYVCTATPSAFS